ncbi:MAG: sensor histidine kinase [Candidatus Margulisiibacteriota bacterium]
MTSYLITKHNLMDIKVLIAKRDSKIITGVVAAGSFGVLYGVLTSLGVGFSLPFYMLLGLAWYGYGQDIQRLIQTPLETKFLKGFYNVEKVVQAISQGLFIANSRDDVIAVVTGEFANTIQIKNVITVLAYENELSHRVEYHCQELSASLDARAHTEHVLPPKNLLIQRFHADGSIVFWDDLDPELKHRFPLSPFKGSLVIPFHSNLYLQGLVILGPKLSEEPWTQQDIALFASVISQVMIVFDRIAHQEKLKNAYDQLDSLNQELQKRVQEEVQKSETSIRIAQELSHKASLATLATGIAHEIRNPMAAMQAHMLFLADKLGGTHYDVVDENDDYHQRLWRFFVGPEQFLWAVGGDRTQARLVVEALQAEGYLTEAGELTTKLNPLLMDASELDLGDAFKDHIVAIREAMKTVLQLAGVYTYLNTAATQYTRILYIADNMMRYGMSGGGVKKDSFTQIEGISETDSEALFDELVEKGYLDNKGYALESFQYESPNFKLNVSPRFLPVEHAVQWHIQNTPGAVKTKVDVAKILKSAQSILAGSAHKIAITLTLDLDKSLPQIRGDELRLQQAVFNVMFNAIQALEPLEKPDKSIVVTAKKATFLGHQGRQIPGIEINIADNGPGISAETKEKIFHPFFTTKGPTGGKNAGLGLSILQDVILAHGGTIQVDSEVGKGTAFRLFLPVG